VASIASQVLLRERYERQATGNRRQATGVGSVPGLTAAATDTLPTDKLIADS